MKKLICLFLQVISLCMWFVYIVDKEKVGLLFNSKTSAENSAIQVIYILLATTILIMAIIGFLTPMILKILHKKYYSHLELHGYGTWFSPIWVLTKSSFMMIFLFVILIPVYFVPVLNIIAFSIPFYYFFHKLLNFDVSSTILSAEQYKIIYEKEANNFRLRTLFLYFISMIPFATLFTAVYYIIYLGHSYFVKLEELNKIENN